MIYFTKIDTGYRMFQTTVLYNTKAIYMWFEVFFFSEDQFKRLIEFKGGMINSQIRGRVVAKLNFDLNPDLPFWMRYTKDQETVIDVGAENLREELIRWYLKVGDLSNKSEFYNGMERLLVPIIRKPTFHYYIHYNRRIKQVTNFNENRVSEARLKELRPKCSKSDKPVRIKTILKSIWDDELEIDIAYKMLVQL